ncbi:MAG: NUDIX hydrolase [Pseudomonadota bacterium]
MSDSKNKSVLIGLSAVIVAVHDARPKVFIVRGADHGVFDTDVGIGLSRNALPFGAFDPETHETLEIGLRKWVESQTPLEPGYVEQLYTFGNRGRYMGQEENGPRVVSVGYLALSRYLDRQDINDNENLFWSDWYDYFPWEDWRDGRPAILESFILPALEDWAVSAETEDETLDRQARIRLCFGGGRLGWDDEKVLERYELLYSARLVYEACRDKKIEADPSTYVESQPMQFDHRRILATSIGRLRGKLKYRPIVFEMMPESFTLLELQRTVEAIAGHNLHKQNFRRLVENSGMVEETGKTTKRGGGRPANLFRFREEVMLERLAPGVKLSPAGM